MPIQILYPKPVYDTDVITGWKPSVYVGGTGEKLNAHVAIDLNTSPPQVVYEYPNINYKFFAGLLPDTFTDVNGSLRSSTGGVVFWGCPQQEESDDGDDPWHPRSRYSKWTVDKIRQDIDAAAMGINTQQDLSDMLSILDPRDAPTIANYTQVFKKSIRSNP